MKILVTGSKGMVGRALVNNLRNIKDRKNRTRPGIKIEEIYEYDIDSTFEELEEYCSKADFVFNLAGVNVPKDPEDFMKGNFGFASTLLETLKKYDNKATVMLSSSVQATLAGPYENSEWGRSKRAGEELFFEYGQKNDVKVAVYRFPSLMGHSRPKYNSVVSSLCYAIANDLPYEVPEKNAEAELLYIDDLIEGMFDLLESKEERCEYEGVEASESMFGRYCYIPVTHTVTFTRIVSLLEDFSTMPFTGIMPKMPKGSFESKLYSLFLTYLPKEKVKYHLESKKQSGAIMTDILKTEDSGSVSIVVIKPGEEAGKHWHNSKWMVLTAVCGTGLITQKNINSGNVVEYEVNGGAMESVYMLPGWVHIIKNTSQTENLVMVMMCNDSFDSATSDTFNV